MEKRPTKKPMRKELNSKNIKHIGFAVFFFGGGGGGQRTFFQSSPIASEEYTLCLSCTLSVRWFRGVFERKKRRTTNNHLTMSAKGGTFYNMNSTPSTL